MTRLSAVTVLGLLSVPLAAASGQFGLNSKRETYQVPVSHPPELVLPKVKRIAIAGFSGSNQCGQEIREHLSETITRSGTFELIDRTGLGSLRAEQDLQASAFADPAHAVKLGRLLGPSAILSGTVTRCDAGYSAITSRRMKDLRGRAFTVYSRETYAHLALSVQVIDVATSKVVLFRTFDYNPVETRSANDKHPDAVDAGAVLAAAVLAGGEDVAHLLFGWRESVKVTVHADKECDLKVAASQIRGGDFTGAAETMEKAIGRQCGTPTDKIALAKAYHNRGIALTYAGSPDEGLISLQRANSLWPGNISEEAILAAQKLIKAHGQQQMQDGIAAEADKATDPGQYTTAAALNSADAPPLSNKDIVDMAQAKLSDQIIISKVRTASCRFDTSPSALIQLKRSGVSDAVVLALAEAQCAR